MKKTILLLLLLIIPAFGQQRAAVYDLGPEVFSTYRISKGYPWRAWGYVYRRGTYASRPACEYDDSIKPVGLWVIHGTTGNPSRYRGTYRITIGAQTVFFNGEVAALDDDGFPLSSLFETKGAGEGGRAEITPRTTQCFGGELKVFNGE